ncbi:DUF397 domain-containing protein [Peterkaempfera bronchialis]|uniref:DUF397 domain-containing protein n=1 Tax=Peterkaempfera bronchialis TaxID=2126346 RepID=A0A345SZ31_9ACTN|nr:DUF397 domain-containing protein [Peterkaempfera bronchialis]AXI78986.1 DUF397 domain-containing protein [Peterkaempfera bronchialis]
MSTTPLWTKSSHSGGNEGQCIEVALNLPDTVPVRDSKDPNGPTLTFTPAAFTAFITAATTGEFDTA